MDRARLAEAVAPRQQHAQTRIVRNTEIGYRTRQEGVSSQREAMARSDRAMRVARRVYFAGSHADNRSVT